jgi:uncharacterized RDD family membrane protein YckC
LRSSSPGAELDSSLLSPGQPSPEWKREANRRLALHRARRSGRTALQTAFPGMEEQVDPEDTAFQSQSSHSRASSVADRVAARYAKAPTYSEMLANEARNVARAAEVAAVAAGAARNAAQAILVGLDVDADAGESPSLQAMPNPLITEAIDEEDGEVLTEDEAVAPVQPLPAKLIEFPRELIATRKARPRLVEGPLREEYDREASRSQLRIFEVEQETISTEPAVEPVLPEWSAIRLDSPPAAPPQHRSRHHAEAPGSIAASAKLTAASNFDLPIQTASLEDRLMAGLVDAALILGGFLVFVLVFVACTVHPPVGTPALIGGAVALGAFAAIYQLLFFNFGADTPGMRYAKIALCTFDDENPTRQAMRRRLAAVLLAVIPMGLGILWAFFDDDRLGWHDRISRTYQRSYR